MQLLLLCRNSRTIALVQPGLTVGWLAGRQNAGKFHIFKMHCRSNLKLLLHLTEVTALLEQYECV